MTRSPRLFDASGLRAGAAARVVADAGPVRWGPDGHFWTYADGLWAPGEPELHRRIVRVLGERYRPAHAATIRDVLRATVEPIEVAARPDLINVANGMVDWAADMAPMLVPHDPGYLSTVQLPWNWGEDPSDCTEFDAFLAAAVAPDDRERVWELIGYLTMSGNPLQRMILLTGGGGNGKGVLLAVIRALLGRRNVSSVALGEFVDDRFAAADVHGRLCNICGDIDTTYIERTGKIKALSGEDLIRGERKFEHGFAFEFWGKSIFSANGIPTAADSSEGWLRRWEIVHFPNKPTSPDRGLKARLTTRTVLEAVLVKAVMALRRVMKRGEFSRGAAAVEAHHAFAVRNNRLLAWIDEEAYRDPGAFYPRKVLLSRFRLWDNQENPGGRPMGSQTFYERLRQIDGLREVKNAGVWGFRGLRLLTDVHVVRIDDDDQSEKLPQLDGAEVVGTHAHLF